MPAPLEIARWDETFETAKSRSVARPSWVPLPNDVSSMGYVTLMDAPTGAQDFGVFVALVKVAQRCEPRGILQRRDGMPHCVKSLSLLTRIPSRVLCESIKRLAAVGWVTGDTPRILDGHLTDTAGAQGIPIQEERRGEEKILKPSASQSSRKMTARSNGSKPPALKWDPEAVAWNSVAAKHPGVKLPRCRNDRLPEKARKGAKARRKAQGLPSLAAWLEEVSRRTENLFRSPWANGTRPPGGGDWTASISYLFTEKGWDQADREPSGVTGHFLKDALAKSRVQSTRSLTDGE